MGTFAPQVSGTFLTVDITHTQQQLALDANVRCYILGFDDEDDSIHDKLSRTLLLT